MCGNNVWYNEAMNKIWKIGLPILLVGIMAFVTVGMTAGTAGALTLQEGAEAARCDGCPEDLFGDTGVFKQITNTILYIVGVIAVIVLIIGGIRYLISGGDSKKVTDAKNTVLYAIIGLIIALLSFAIVNFVISALPSGDSRRTTDTSQSSNSGEVQSSQGNEK